MMIVYLPHFPFFFPTTSRKVKDILMTLYKYTYIYDLIISFVLMDLVNRSMDNIYIYIFK